MCYFNYFKMYSSVALNTFTLLCKYHHVYLELFHLPKLKLYSLHNNSPWSTLGIPPAPANHHDIFCLFEFAHSRYFIWVDLIGFVPLWCTYFILGNVFRSMFNVHVAVSRFYLFIYFLVKWCFIVCRPYYAYPLIYWWILGYIHFLVIVRKYSVSMGMDISLRDPAFICFDMSHGNSV